MKGATKRTTRTPIEQGASAKDQERESTPLEIDVDEQEFTPLPEVLQKREVDDMEVNKQKTVDDMEVNKQKIRSQVTVQKKAQDSSVEQRRSQRTTKRPDRFGNKIYEYIKDSEHDTTE